MPKHVKSSASYYAVRVGRQPGVYRTWEDCRQQVERFPDARYKRFTTEHEANQFINCSGGSNSSTAPASSSTGKSPANNRRPYTFPSANAKPPMKLSCAAGNDTDPTITTKTVVYADGSCLGNGRKDGAARAGVGVFFGPGDGRNISERLAGPKQTNQRAEITAAIRTLETLRGTGGNVEIHTDSKYVIKAMTEWIHNWIAKDWSGKQMVENRDLFERLHRLIVDRQPDRVEFIYVPGHSGDYGNDQADLLARQGAEMNIIP